MNPVSRRGQILLALAAAENGFSIRRKENQKVRLDEARQLLTLFERQLASSDLDEETREAMEEKKELLETKIQEKKEKKDL